jgi:threonine dehydrogenase-like Zn-dependent dehydrogenase
MFTNRLREGGVDRVIAIDRVPWRLQWARRMGATDVVDASRRDTMGAVRELTSGAMVDLCVEAVGTEEALCTAAFLPRRGGKLCVFGVPQTDSQRFPWFHTTGNETEIVTSRGAGWMDYAGTAVHMVAGDGTGLADLVTPRLPWDRAAEAFEMYANPARHEGTLKLVLEF